MWDSPFEVKEEPMEEKAESVNSSEGGSPSEGEESESEPASSSASPPPRCQKPRAAPAKHSWTDSEDEDRSDPWADARREVPKFEDCDIDICAKSAKWYMSHYGDSGWTQQYPVLLREAVQALAEEPDDPSGSVEDSGRQIVELKGRSRCNPQRRSRSRGRSRSDSASRRAGGRKSYDGSGLISKLLKIGAPPAASRSHSATASALGGPPDKLQKQPKVKVHQKIRPWDPTTARGQRRIARADKFKADGSVGSRDLSQTGPAKMQNACPGAQCQSRNQFSFLCTAVVRLCGGCCRAAPCGPCKYHTRYLKN